MTEQETREKIVGIITHEYVTDKDYAYIFDPRIEEKINNMADALITAGLCDKNTLDERYQTLMAAGFVQLASLRLDLEKVLHRAEVAERALLITAREIMKARGYADSEIEYLAKEIYIHEVMKQAEKELEEERKDD